MMPNENIDELLTSFLDDELSPRRRTEVQRLVAHDEEVAKRYRQLRRCRTLLQSLPAEQAPPGLAQSVLADLNRRVMLGKVPALGAAAGRGGRHLFMRNLVATAAMIALIAVLGAVVYNIVMPVSGPSGPLGPVGPPVGGRPAVASSPFSGRLALTTGDFAVVDQFIRAKLIDSGLSNRTQVTAPTGKAVYSIACDRAAADRLLAALSEIWPRCESTTLYVDPESFGPAAAIDSVSAAQACGIVRQGDPDARMRLAQRFTSDNRLDQLMPGRAVAHAMDAISRPVQPPSLVRPVLTGPPQEQRPDETSSPTVYLTIILDNAD